MAMPYLVGIVGVSNSGKTTLIERLLPLLRARGLRVGTLKHDAHGFDLDRPGKDTWRHREAGAEAVLISGPGQLALMRRLEGPTDPQTLADTYMPDMDLVLVEGYKRFDLPRFEVVRAANSTAPVCAPEELAGLVTDLPLAYGTVPVYGLDDAETVAQRMLALAGLT
jgi:molybdopterin-guanine dinucleotide biosynthesis protein B